MKTKIAKHYIGSAVALVALMSVAACDTDSTVSTLAATGTTGIDSAGWAETEFRCGARTINWAAVNDWHYQLQNMDFGTMAASKYDLLTIDGELKEGTISRNIVERMQCDGDGEKLVISYLPIGQGESYRYYWQEEWQVGNPSWIVRADEFYPGYYYVKFWEQDWKNILWGSETSRLDRIIAAGFDGVYLGTVDGYAALLNENPNAREDMRQLVTELAAYAREKSGNPDFGIFVQNAEELIETVGQAWVEPLTGIGKEEPFFWATDNRVEDSGRYWNDYYLSQWTAAGKIVLSVDYVTTAENIDEVYQLGTEKGYVPLALQSKVIDKFTVNSGHEPN